MACCWLPDAKQLMVTAAAVHCSWACRRIVVTCALSNSIQGAYDVKLWLQGENRGGRHHCCQIWRRHCRHSGTARYGGSSQQPVVHIALQTFISTQVYFSNFGNCCLQLRSYRSCSLSWLEWLEGAAKIAAQQCKSACQTRHAPQV